MKENQSNENSTPDVTGKPAEIIYALRSDYASRSLDEETASADPFEQFERWLAEAIADAADEANAMTVATAAPDGQPSARIVLLRGFSADGFVFFTNYESRKGAEIAANPRASLLFYWPRLERQVRVDGRIEKAPRAVSEEYFASRPRESQLGAWASAQSAELASREQLEAKLAALEKEFAGRDVPCPDFWGGYVVRPDAIEFWQGRPSRLHDRLRYERDAEGWRRARLSP